VKQSNLRRGGRPLGQKVATLPGPPADQANESRVASLHSDSCGADCPIPRGIVMLIDILAREALKEVIAKHLKLEATRRREARDGSAWKTQRDGNRGSRRYKDQILSAARLAPDRFIPTKSDRYKDQIGFVGSGGRI
jgi:hypothetical protein